MEAQNAEPKITIAGDYILPACLIFVHIWLLRGKPGSLWKPAVQKISSVEGNLFIFGLVCYFCPPGSQKINILTAQYKWTSKEQGVRQDAFTVLSACTTILCSNKRPKMRTVHPRFTRAGGNPSYQLRLRWSSSMKAARTMMSNIRTWHNWRITISLLKGQNIPQ